MSFSCQLECLSSALLSQVQKIINTLLLSVITVRLFLLRGISENIIKTQRKIFTRSVSFSLVCCGIHMRCMTTAVRQCLIRNISRRI